MKHSFYVMSIIAFIATIIILVLWYGKAHINTFNNLGNAIQALIFAILELFGIIFLLIMLYVYFYTHRDQRFTFDGFSGSPGGLQGADSLTNMNKLAKEELIKQFSIIREELSLCVVRYEKNDYNYEEDNVIIQKYKQDYPYKDTDLTVYFRPFGEHEHTLSINVVVSTIRQLIEIAPEYLIPTRKALAEFTLQQIGEEVPQPFRPLVKFIDALVPPNTIRATAYLQRYGHGKIPHRKPGQRASFCTHGPVGITLELEDLSKKISSTIHTLWQPALKNEEQKLAKESEEDLPGYFIDLLPPLMRWLVLLFWEFNLLEKQAISKKNTLRREREKFFFVLAMLHLYSAEQFTDHREFFSQQALEHLQQAIQINQEWFLPRMSSGLIYSLLVEGTQETEKRCKWIDAGLKALAQALHQAEGAGEEQDVRSHIRILQMLLKLYRNPEHFKELEQEFQDLVKYNDPAYFDTTPEFSGAYAYNLANWCARVANDRSIAVPEISRKAYLEMTRLYLAYSLARARRLWLKIDHDCELQIVGNNKDKLKEELQKQYEGEMTLNLPEQDRLAYLQGETFKKVIYRILRKIGWETAIPRMYERF